MNVSAKFDEIPSMILQDIKETKRYGHKNVSDKQSFGQRENSIPFHKHSLRGGINIFKEHWGGRVGLGGQDGCERRIKDFVKIQKKKKNFWGGGQIGGWGSQGGCEQRIEVLVRIKKKTSSPKGNDAHLRTSIFK